MTIMTEAQAKHANDQRLLSQFTQETTMHGFRYVHGSTNTGRKLIWIILIVLCAFFLVVQIKSKVEDYRANPISTNIDVEYPTSMYFPAIALCNTNQFRISYTRNNVYDMITEIYRTGKVNVDHNFTQFHPGLKQLGHSSSLTFLKDAGPSIEDMLLVCHLPNGEKCTAKHFKLITTDFGVCHAINTDKVKPLKVNSAGVHSGIYMLFNIEAYERMGSPTTTEGLKVLIYNQTSLPMISMQGIDVPPGFLSQIGVSLKMREKLPVAEGGTCVTSTPMDHFQNVGNQYSVEKCKLDKQIEQIAQKCKCLPFHSPEYNSEKVSRSRDILPLCTVKQHFSCVIAQNEMPESAGKCKENCTTVTFDPFLSMSKLPTESLEAVVGTAKNAKMFKHFKQSMEARARIQEDHVATIAELIDGMRGIDEQLTKLQYRPFKEEFRGVPANLYETVKCFREFHTEHSELIERVDHLSKELRKGEVNLNMVLKGKVLYPNMTAWQLYEGGQELMSLPENENRSHEIDHELTEMLQDLVEILEVFDERTYDNEIKEDNHPYRRVFKSHG